MARPPPESSPKRLTLRKRLAQVPITSVALYTTPSGKEYVLAGEDGVVRVYNVVASASPSGGAICRTLVFDDQPIHGLGLHGSRILVWGAARVALVDAAGLDDDAVGAPPLAVLASVVAPDWIYDGIVSPWDQDEAVLASAHNEVIRLRYVNGTLELEEAMAPSRPMLYVARMAWLMESCVLVGAGTVFGHVVVWKGDLLRHSCALLSVLRGHEGSVYDLDILCQPEREDQGDGKPTRLLASCSDDRTIRIWDISKPVGENGDPGQGDDETGFRAAHPKRGEYAENGEEETEGEDARQVAMAMGHASRIWGVRFASKGSFVYSFGEDATVQEWEIQMDVTMTTAGGGGGGGGSGKSLTKRRVFAHHEGKHLWARSIHQGGRGRTHILTGGADGKISLMEIGGQGEDDEDSASMHITVSLGTSEIITRYDFTQKDQMLAITSLGRLFRGNLTQNSWQEVDTHHDLRDTYVLKRVSRHSGAVVLGTTAGDVFYCCTGSQPVHLVGNVSGRILDISCLSETQILVHVHGTPRLRFLTLDAKTGHLVQEQGVEGLDPRFVPVSAAVVGQALVIGSRHGYMSLLALQGVSWCSAVNISTRSRDAITAIVPLPSRDESPSPYMLVTSRDGMYRIYQIKPAHATTTPSAPPAPSTPSTHSMLSPSITLIHETAPPLGPMIEGAWFTTGAKPELMLYGFRSKNFVIWNESTRQEVATVDCGGAHRTFRLDYSAQEPERCRFAYTRTSRLHVFCQRRLEHTTIKAGMHGREIRALSASKQYVATGAEDTTIRIWGFADANDDEGEAEMRCLACIKAHVTGIQKLGWFEDDYLFSSAGNEEFFVWRTRKLDSAYDGLAVVCEGKFTEHSPMRDLRIMDFDVSRPGDVGGESIVVSLAFSNSTFKTYRYDGAFGLLSSGSYTGACLTQLRHLQVGRGGLDIMTASTDGHLAIWSTRPEDATEHGVHYTMTGAVAVHQSSIKCLDMISDGRRSRKIMTGGDDNALGFVELDAVVDDGTGRPRYQFAGRGVVRAAHAAAINGLVLMSTGGDGGDGDGGDGDGGDGDGGDGDGGDDGKQEVLGVSVSNDQRIKVWRMPADAGQSVVALAVTVRSGVADAGDVVLVSQGRRTKQVIVGGVGVEAWTLVNQGAMHGRWSEAKV